MFVRIVVDTVNLVILQVCHPHLGEGCLALSPSGINADDGTLLDVSVEIRQAFPELLTLEQVIGVRTLWRNLKRWRVYSNALTPSRLSKTTV